MYLNRRIRVIKLTGDKAQGSLEIAVAISAVILLLWGSFVIFLWLNKGLVIRQEGYADTNFYATQFPFEYPVPEPPPLKFE